MTYQSIIDALSAYRRPGTPNFDRHFARLPPELVRHKHVPILLDILADGDLPPKIRGHAAGVLGEIGDDRVVCALIEALSDRRLRRCAVVALGRLGAAAAAEDLALLAQRGDTAARWALARAKPAAQLPEVIDELESGQLRGIRSRLQVLDRSTAAAVADCVVRRLQDALDNETPDQGWAWMVTCLQYLRPPPAGPLLTDVLRRLDPSAVELRSRLLRALGAIAPLEAVSALLSALSTIESPGHQQLTAVCLEKILARRGEPARKAVADEATALRRVLADLHERDCRTSDTEPMVPWDHRPGTPGWRAEVVRAQAALTRLLRRLSEPPQGSRYGCADQQQL